MAYYRGQKILFSPEVIVSQSGAGYNEGYEKGRQDGYAEGEVAGYNNGYELGKTEGTTEGYNNGVTEGKRAEYKAFWDAFQHEGARTNYTYAFSGEVDGLTFMGGWDDTNYKPLYYMAPTNASYMYMNSAISAIELDLSNCANCTALCSTCRSLVSAELVVSNKISSIQNMFRSCESLTTLTFEGTWGANNLSVQWSPLLTRESLLSIINALEDKSTDTSGTTWKVTFGNENIAKLTADELQRMVDKGWDYA